ncbi:MAG TPA: hypothetical protein PLC53_01730, partial [Bacilli bacterium]|nr:hypothetical protein [Bacilli bacterium]
MKNKFLLFLVILIALLVGGLGFYTYFIWDGNKDINEKTNNIEFSYNESNYEYLLSGETKEVSDLTPYELVLSTISEVTEEKYNINDIDKLSIDSDGINYPDYSDETENRVCSADATY